MEPSSARQHTQTYTAHKGADMFADTRGVRHLNAHTSQNSIIQIKVQKRGAF